MSWNPISAIGDAISGVAGVIKEPIKQWGERKAIQLQAKMDVEKLNAQAQVASANARLEMAKNGQMIEADWDAEAQRQMKFSWKDEFLLVVIIFPFIGSFIPKVQDAMLKGWGYIAKAPYWYLIAFLGVYAAVFGLRWLIAPLVREGIKSKVNGKQK